MILNEIAEIIKLIFERVMISIHSKSNYNVFIKNIIMEIQSLEKDEEKLKS
jgi:hypothetical protein